MNINTKTKIRIASILSNGTRFLRSCAGYPNAGVFKRNGIKWNLDLSQGIDFAIFLQGYFEPSTIRSYKKYIAPGDVVLDIGANIGSHTLPLAHLVGDTGSVIAFEPTDYAFGKLMENLRLNSRLANRVIPVQAMLLGTAQAEAPESIPSSWSLDIVTGDKVHEIHGGTFQSLNGASLLRLDDWFEINQINRLDFVKLDVDGYEIDVIEGGLQTLSRYSPDIMMELAPYVFEERGKSFKQLISMLNKLNFRCWEVSGAEIPLNDDLSKKIPAGGSMNVILSKQSPAQ